MQRTNIYLDERQLSLLRALSGQRSQAVAVLVREAVDAWLDLQGVQVVDSDEWDRRFRALLQRRAEVATAEGFDEQAVRRDVTAAVAQVRSERRARGS